MSSSSSLRLVPETKTLKTRLPDEQSLVLSQLSGESLYLPSTNTAVRLPASKHQTGGNFAMVVSQGAATEPILPHFHREAIDVFICTRGSLQVYLNDESRILYPGDMALVPPGAVHSYAQRGAAHTEFFGIITPGGWEQFFHILSDPMDDKVLLYPTGDQAPFPFERFGRVMAEGIDVVPQPKHQLVDATPFTDKDMSLPTGGTPYYLKADCGPRFTLAGQQLEILARPVNSGNKFSIAWLDGSSELTDSFLGSSSNAIRFEKAYTHLRVISGKVQLSLLRKGSSKAEVEVLHSGEDVLIIPGDAFRLDFLLPLSRLCVTTCGPEYKGGIESLFESLGQSLERNQVFGGGQEIKQVEEASLKAAVEKIEASLVQLA